MGETRTRRTVEYGPLARLARPFDVEQLRSRVSTRAHWRRACRSCTRIRHSHLLSWTGVAGTASVRFAVVASIGAFRDRVSHYESNMTVPPTPVRPEAQENVVLSDRQNN